MRQNLTISKTSFGSSISEMSFSNDTLSGYRYGFNNQEKDGELGDYYAFEKRIHDARLGRFLSVDPLSAEYPWNSSYAFAENRVIDGIDLEGREWLSAKSRVYVSNGIIYAWTDNMHAPLRHFYRASCWAVNLSVPLSDKLGTLEFGKAKIETASPNPPQSANPTNAAEKYLVQQTSTLSPLRTDDGRAAVAVLTAAEKNNLSALTSRTIITSKKPIVAGNNVTILMGVVKVTTMAVQIYTESKLKDEVNAVNFELSVVNRAFGFLLDKVNSNAIPTEFCNDEDLSEILNVMLTGLKPPGIIENTGGDKKLEENNKRLMTLYNLGWDLINEAGEDPATKLEAAAKATNELITKLDENTTDNTYSEPAVVPLKPKGLVK